MLNNGAYIYDVENDTYESVGKLDDSLIKSIFNQFKEKSYEYYWSSSDSMLNAGLGSLVVYTAYVINMGERQCTNAKGSGERKNHNYVRAISKFDYKSSTNMGNEYTYR